MESYNTVVGSLDWNIVQRYCLSEDIVAEIDGDLRKVCRLNAENSLTNFFVASEGYDPWLVSTSNNRRNPFMNYQPYIHGCNFPSEFRTKKIEIIGLSFQESLEGKGNYYFYQNPTDYYEVETQNTFWSQKFGRFRTFVTDVSVADDADRTCEFNLYTCNQLSIGQSEDDVAADILKIFQENKDVLQRELKGGVYTDTGFASYCTVNFFGYCVYSVGWTYKTPTIFSYPHVFNYTLSAGKRAATNLEIISAIDAGIWEWNRQYYEDKDVIGSFPRYNDSRYVQFNYLSWDLKGRWQGDITYDNDCWNNAFLNTDFLKNIDRPTLYYYPTQMPETYTNFKMRILLIKEKIPANINGENVNLLRITPFITLCGG